MTCQWANVNSAELTDWNTMLAQKVSAARAAKQAQSSITIPPACSIKSMPTNATEEEKRCGFGATARMLLRALLCYELPPQDIEDCMTANCVKYDEEWGACGLS